MKRTAIALALIVAAGCASSDSQRAPAALPADPRLQELQTSMTELLERLDVMNDRMTRLEQASDQPRATQPAVQPSAAPRETAAAPVVQSSRSLANADIAERYREAIVLFGKNRVDDARKVFQHVFDTDPSGELADNALFWIGETYYSAGDYPNATRFYKRVAEEYGDQNKAPDALLKLALTFARTGDLALAHTTLQDVIARYPYSSSAASAKLELNRIKY